MIANAHISTGATNGSAGLHCSAVQQIRAEIAAELELQPREYRQAFVADLCERSGGSLITPGDGGPNTSHQAELSLFGVCQFGPTVHAVISEWIKSVVRISEHTDQLGAAA